jgi:hypothetical protein
VFNGEAHAITGRQRHNRHRHQVDRWHLGVRRGRDHQEAAVVTQCQWTHPARTPAPTIRA